MPLPFVAVCTGRENFSSFRLWTPTPELYYQAAQHELMITYMHVLGYGGRNRVLSVISICRKVGGGRDPQSSVLKSDLQCMPPPNPCKRRRKTPPPGTKSLSQVAPFSAACLPACLRLCRIVLLKSAEVRLGVWSCLRITYQ